MKSSQPNNGFSLLAVVASIGVLGAISAVVPVLIGSNQSMRTQQLHTKQAYYSARAAFEYSLGQVYSGGDPNPIPARDFAGSAFSIARNNGKIWVTTQKGNATNSFSITDPMGVQAGCLDVVTSPAVWRGDELRQIQLQRKGSCIGDITIVSMQISWSPTANRQLKTIQIKGSPLEYDSPTGQLSGSVFDFGNEDFVLPDIPAIHWIKKIKYDGYVADQVAFTLIFNMIDGSSKTVAFDIAR